MNDCEFLAEVSLTVTTVTITTTESSRVVISECDDPAKVVQGH